MKKFSIEVIEKDSQIYLYSDPEFAALMWPEVEADVEDNVPLQEDDVVMISLRKGEKWEVEWLGFEMVEEEKVTNARFVQNFGHNMSEILNIPTLNYEGWIPYSRFQFTEGTQNGIKITRI